ncbi:hypothetical protein [Neobacillus sp. SAB-20_R2A]|uniref:hypothetical protein n=1 Tax=Neobacillus sp. SAB-20_R2A TaxID=3120519 RepID=UPI003C6DBB4D
MAKVRLMEARDIIRCVEIENSAWVDPLAKEYSFTSKHFEELIKVNPNGQFVVENNGLVVGFANTQRINYVQGKTELKTWAEMCNKGFISKTHIPNGDTVFGINLSFSKEAPFTASGILLAHIATYTFKNSIRSVVLGGRLPFYHKYANQMSPEDYINAKRKSGKPLDPELHIYKKAGCRPVKVIPNYFPDSESLNYGVLLIWNNPLYRISRKSNQIKEKILGR